MLSEASNFFAFFVSPTVIHSPEMIHSALKISKSSIGPSASQVQEALGVVPAPHPTVCPGLKESRNQPLRCSWVPSKWEHSMIPRCCPINNNTCHLKLQPTASQTSPYPPKSRAALWSRGHNHFIIAPSRSSLQSKAAPNEPWVVHSDSQHRGTPEASLIFMSQ